MNTKMSIDDLSVVIEMHFKEILLEATSYDDTIVNLKNHGESLVYHRSLEIESRHTWNSQIRALWTFRQWSSSMDI